MLPLDAPLDPDQGEGQQWLRDELAKAEYQQAKPTLIDQIGQAIGKWFGDLLGGVGHTPPAVGIAIVLAIAAVVVVILVLVYGLPRLNRRSAAIGALFGDDERRSAAELRADAEAAARRGEWAAAIADMFRSIARGLAERELVATLPGTTAHAFAERAAQPFPDAGAALAQAATAFDHVRYLGEAGTREAFDDVAALEARLRAARPSRATTGTSG